jgi:pectinesterase
MRLWEFSRGLGDEAFVICAICSVARVKRAGPAAGAAFFTVALLSATVRANNYYVDPTGPGPLGNGTNTYTNVQAALSGVPAGTAANPSRIYIDPGTYTQQLSLSNKAYVDLIGVGSNPSQTVLTYDLNANSPNGSGGTIGTTGSSSTTIRANNFTASNIAFANSSAYGSGQAVALKAQGDEMAFENCDFIGYQDTLYADDGRQYFTNCYVTGSVDFIFGNATAVFNGCTINNSENGTVTAADTNATTAVGFVIENSKLTATNPGAGNGEVQLGRPWDYGSGSYSNVTYLNDTISSDISSYLWNPWDSSNTNPAGDTRYAQYGLVNSSGSPLNPSSFVTWSHNLSGSQESLFTLANIFGPASFWNNSTWGIAGSEWGPVNADNTSGVTTPITASSYINWTLGGTWDPTAQLASAAVPEPATAAVLFAISGLFGMRRPRRGRRGFSGRFLEWKRGFL